MSALDGDDEEYDELLKERTALEAKSFEIPSDDLVIQEELGEGFFGKVHKAKLRKSIVAVKKITRSNFREQSEVDLFHKEINIMSKIQHKCCVLFVGVCTDPQNRCIVSEYCAGGNLRELLENKPYLLTNDLKRSIATDIVNGFIYLHSWNPPIIHRDLTSNNILLSRSLHAKVADFGLSRERNAQMTTAVGSLSYMAPEAFLGLSYNETVDVYSFGQLLYELVTGREPHFGMNSQRFAFLVALEDYRQSLEGFTKPMQELIAACWQRAPDRRPSFSNISQILDKLTNDDFVRGPYTTPNNSISQIPNSSAPPTNPRNPKLARSNSNILPPSRTSSNVSMTSASQSSDPDDVPGSPSSPPFESSSPSEHVARRPISTSTERNSVLEGSDSPYSAAPPANVTTQTTKTETTHQPNVYSNYSVYADTTGRFGYYYEGSKGSLRSSICDDEVHVCPCLDDPQADCPLLEPPKVLTGHSKSVNRVRGDGADNDFIVSCSEDNTVRVWPVSETCKQKQGVINHNTNVTAVQGVRIQKRIYFIVSGDERGDIVNWESKNYRSIRTIKNAHNGPITNFAWGGTKLVSCGSDASVKLWDFEGAKCVSTFSKHTKKVNDVHCDANQVLIVSSSDDGTIKLWDSRIGQDFRTLRVHTGDAVLCAKMRSTGRDNILVSGSTTGQVAVWDMHAPYCITTHARSTARVCDVDFDNTHNRVFAAYADGSVTVFETNAWTPCHIWHHHAAACNSMVFAQNSNSLATGYVDGTVVVSEVKDE